MTSNHVLRRSSCLVPVLKTSARCFRCDDPLCNTAAAAQCALDVKPRSFRSHKALRSCLTNVILTLMHPHPPSQCSSPISPSHSFLFLSPCSRPSCLALQAFAARATAVFHQATADLSLAAHQRCVVSNEFAPPPPPAACDATYHANSEHMSCMTTNFSFF